MRKGAFTQEEVTEFQQSIVNELDLIHSLTIDAFNMACDNKNTKKVNKLILDKVYRLKNELQEDIKIEASSLND